MGSENGPYQGLLVDWGGVLTTDVFAAFRAFCELEGLEPDTLRQRFREDPSSRDLLIALETGQIDEDEFEPRFAEVLGVDAPGLIERVFAGAGPDEDMLAAVERARAQGVRTGLISNSWGTRRYDREQLGRLFDGVVISGEIGIRKPSPEIYALGAEKIGLPPGRCVFVDDLPFNLKPAAELGMATVRHSSSAETIAELESLLGVALR
ncbi:MAG TPA: HAD family phosphatase [Solirubrobacteraceae bacterium]|nr:HAD family phosphatase [Solirubrobacteraceae bacterium]